MVTTVNVTGYVKLPDNSEASGAVVTFQLSASDYDTAGDTAIPKSKTSVTLGSGGSITAPLWPNDRGTVGTYYFVDVIWTNSDGKPVSARLGTIQPVAAGPNVISDLLAVGNANLDGIAIAFLTDEEYQAAVAAADILQAGVTYYNSTADGLAATSSGDYFIVKQSGGLADYLNDGGSATFNTWIKDPVFDTVAEFLASGVTGNIGDVVTTRDGIGRYIKVADGTGHVPLGSPDWEVLSQSLQAFGAMPSDSGASARAANDAAFALTLSVYGYVSLDADYYTSAPIDIGFSNKIYGNGFTIYPSANTRAIRVSSSRWTISDLIIDYATQQGAADTSAVGILFNKGAFEGVISNVMVMKAYRGVSLGNDVDASDPFVYMALMTSVRVLDAYDWGIALSNSGSVGMTTNTLVNCYVLQTSVGTNPAAKGMLFQYQTGGLTIVNCAVDKCSGRALLLNGCTAVSVTGFYTEGNAVAGTHLIDVSSCASSKFDGITSFANMFSGTSSVVRVGGTSGQITISGREQGSSSTGTLYGIKSESSNPDVWVEALDFETDSGLPRSDGLVSAGRRQIASYDGIRLAEKKAAGYIEYRNSAPTTGTWRVGDEVRKDSIAVGDVAGFMCVSAGSPGTWVPSGGQVGVRTNAGTPIGVLVPRFVGEEVLNTSSGGWFKSTGTTASSWQAL